MNEPETGAQSLRVERDYLAAEVERLNNLVHAENGRADFNLDEAEHLRGLLRGETECAEKAEEERDEYKRLHAHAADLYEMFRRKYDDEGDRSERYRLAWLSARAGRKLARSAWRYGQWRIDAQAEEMREQDAFARSLWDMLTERRKERDRYRTSWLSARRRAARESEFAAEALAMKDAEIASLKAQLAESVAGRDAFAREIRPVVESRMAERARLRAFVDEVRTVRGWTMCGETYRSHLLPIYDALHELEEADREGRCYRDHWTRNGPERMAGMCPACDIIPDSVPQPAPCLCGDEAATVAYWRENLSA